MFQTLAHLPLGWLLFVVITASGFISFYAGRTAFVGQVLAAGPQARVHSQPNYHGYFTALSTILPIAAVFVLYVIFGNSYVHKTLTSELPDYITGQGPLALQQYLDRLSEHVALRTSPDTGNILFNAASERYASLLGQMRVYTLIAAMFAGALGFFLSRKRLRTTFQARNHIERALTFSLFFCAAIAVVTTAGIILSLVFETLRFFATEGAPSITGFLFGTEWNAQTGENFGALPLIFGTFVIALIAMCVAAPIGLFSAIYLSEYANSTVRAWVKPALEVLAGIPTVIYGFFALTLVIPCVQMAAVWINGLPFIPDELLEGREKNALAAGLVMGIMIIPFISSLTDDVINAVPQSLRDGALALGATQAETIKQVILPAALPGIVASMLLAISRAIGETMIVLMAAGQTAQITGDVTSYLSTITVQIVTVLTGDTSFDSAKTLSAFALGFVLFTVTLAFNIIALRVVKKYREQYD